MSDKIKIEVWYEGIHSSGVKTAELEIFLKKGETRITVILEIIRNGFRVEMAERGIFKFIPPHRVLEVRYPE